MSAKIFIKLKRNSNKANENRYKKIILRGWNLVVVSVLCKLNCKLPNLFPHKAPRSSGGGGGSHMNGAGIIVVSL